MKKFTSLLLLILIAALPILSASCSSTQNDAPDSTEAITSYETTEALTEEITEKATEAVSEAATSATDSKTSSFNITDFTIVFPAKNTDAQILALDFKKAIKNATGATVSTSKNTSTFDKEIFIGNCDKEISNSFFAAKDTENKYGIIVKDEKIFIIGTNEEAINKSIKYFISTYLKDGTTFEIEKDAELIFEIKVEIINMPENKKDGELRVVSHNILQQAIKNDPLRKDDLIFAMKILDADVIMMQEVDNPWTHNLYIDSAMAQIGYAKVNVGSHTPIFYKKDAFTVVEFGRTAYDPVTAIGSNSWYVWAVLQEVSTKKRFMVANTHLIWQADASVRTDCARQLVKDAAAVCDKYNGIPVIFSGDFNSSTSSDVYSVMTEIYNSARNNCPTTVNMEYGTTNLCGEPPKVGAEAIDHVFYSKSKIEATRFETIVSPQVYCYSDHVPVCFDFKLS